MLARGNSVRRIGVLSPTICWFFLFSLFASFTTVDVPLVFYSVGSSSPITRDHLLIEDGDTGPADIVYTLLTTPSNGDVTIGGKSVTNFTQLMIDDGHVMFEHRGLCAFSSSELFRHFLRRRCYCILGLFHSLRPSVCLSYAGFCIVARRCKISL